MSVQTTEIYENLKNMKMCFNDIKDAYRDYQKEQRISVDIMKVKISKEVVECFKFKEVLESKVSKVRSFFFW